MHRQHSLRQENCGAIKSIPLLGNDMGRAQDYGSICGVTRGMSDLKLVLIIIFLLLTVGHVKVKRIMTGRAVIHTDTMRPVTILALW
jgi:hypothetical protein